MKTETSSQVVTVGRARLSQAAQDILKELSAEDREKIKDAPARTYTASMTETWKSVPTTLDLALMLTGLIKAKEGETTIRNFTTTMKGRWPVLGASYFNGLRSAVRHILDAEARAEAKGDDTNVIEEDDFKALCDYALKTIQQENRSNAVQSPHLFQRDGDWVEIRYSGDPKTAQIAVLDRETFAARLNAVTFWRKRVGDGMAFRYVSAPKDVVNQVFAHPTKPVPELRGVIFAPMYTANGELVIKSGFHESGFYYAPPPELMVPRPEARPSEADVAKARETLVDILCDFELDGVSRTELEAAVLRCEGEKKWGGRGSRTAVPPSFLSAVGFMLEQLVRPMIDGPVMPLLISKTARRAGGGLLATVMQTVVRGTASMRPLATNEDERRKAILAALRSGTSVIAWDNLPTGKTIDSPTLATLFTEGVYTDRELGSSTERDVPVRASFLLVGNRPPFSDELVQRLTLLELLPQTASPESRTGWKHEDLSAYVREHRARILGALLVLVQNWVAKGQPKPRHAPVIGRYERYRHVIGGILEAAGANWTSWQLNRDKLAQVALDAEEDGWGDLFEMWAKERGTGKGGMIEARKLAAIAQEEEIGLDIARVRDGGQFEYNVRALSKALQGMQERVFDLGEHGTVKLLLHDKRGDGGYPWYLEPIKKDVPKAANAPENVVPMQRPRGRRTTPEERAAQRSASV